MLDNAKKLNLALRVLSILQEQDMTFEEAEEILRRTLAMLQAWHGGRTELAK